MNIFIFILGFTILTYEILLIKIFSVFISPYIASIFISITLFGVGIGNILAFKVNKTKLKNLICMYSISFLFVYLYFYSINFHQNFLSNFVKHFQDIMYVNNIFTALQIIYFFLVLIIFIIPMIINGLMFSLLLSTYGESIEKFYMLNMIGSGSGIFLPFFLLYYINPYSIIIVLSIIVMFYLLIQQYKEKNNIFKISFYCMVLIGIFLFSCIKSNIKFINDDRGILIWEKWNHISKVSIVKKNPEFNNKINIEPNRQSKSEYLLINNNDRGSSFLQFNNDLFKIDFLKKDVTAFPYYILPPRSNVLILGPGAGIDILVPFLFNQNITAVEINPLVIEATNGFFGDYTGHVYSLPQVKTVMEDARNFLHSSNDMFDLISMFYLHSDTYFTAGNFSFIESNLLTIEGFEIYLSHISENGILQISGDFSKKEVLRIIATCKMFKNTNNDSIIILKFLQKCNTILFKKNGFSKYELNEILNKAEEFKVTVLYPKEDNIYSKLIKENINNTNYDITPISDDKPFFFYFKKGMF